MSLLAHHTGTLDFLKFSLGFQKNIVDDRHVIDNFNANNYFGVPKDSAKIFMNKSGNILNITIIGDPDNDTNENKNSTSLLFNNTKNRNAYDETSSKEISDIVSDFNSVVNNKSISSKSEFESNLKQVASDHSVVQVSDLENRNKVKNQEHSITSHAIDKVKNTNKSNWGGHRYSYHNYGTIGDYYTYTITNTLNGRTFSEFGGRVSGRNLDNYFKRKKYEWFNFVSGLNKVSEPFLEPKDERIPTDCCLLACVEPTKYIYIP